MKFEDKFLKSIKHGFKKHTVRKKPYACGCHVLQDTDGNSTDISVEITVCQKIKVSDFLGWIKKAPIMVASEYGFFSIAEMFRYYKKYLANCEFAYAHRLEIMPS